MALSQVPQKVRSIENKYDLVAQEKQTGSGIQIDVDSLVARDGDTFLFVDYLFDSGDLYGVTGTRMRPVHVDEHEKRLEQFYSAEYSPIHHMYVEEVENGLDQSWSEWVRDIPEWERHELMYEESHVGKFGDVVREHAIEELPHFEDRSDVHTVECIGGGRMFPLDQELDEIYDSDLLELVRNVEKTGLGVFNNE